LDIDSNLIKPEAVLHQMLMNKRKCDDDDDDDDDDD